MHPIVDLHCHSVHSDGTLEPQALLTMASQREVRWFALTDHDTMAGYQCLLEQNNLEVGLISGVEISTELEGTELHLVALGVDHQNQELNDLLQYNRDFRKARATWVREKLLHLGYADIQSSLDSVLTGNVVCRTHLAKALVASGIAKDFERAFKQFLGRGGKVWKRPHWQPLRQVIESVHQAGGKAILAHPTKYRLSSTKMTWVIEQFALQGGDALECNYSGLSPNHRHYLKRLALRHQLAASVGSDFHHPGQTWLKLGGYSQIDSDLTPIWDSLTT